MIAIGEIGLDYYRNLSEPETQKKVFKELSIKRQASSSKQQAPAGLNDATIKK